MHTNPYLVSLAFSLCFSSFNVLLQKVALLGALPCTFFFFTNGERVTNANTRIAQNKKKRRVRRKKKKEKRFRGCSPLYESSRKATQQLCIVYEAEGGEMKTEAIIQGCPYTTIYMYI